MTENAAANPFINVTPLIDVLLVLLIIFMVAAPLKPSRFKVAVPAEPKQEKVDPNPDTLIVTVNPDQSLTLNKEAGLGDLQEPDKLLTRLAEVFQTRTQNMTYASGMEKRTDLPTEQRIARHVFIKAPRSLKYGPVARLIDDLKGAGANPVALQIDSLD